jgi:hypothetical protein
MTPEPPSAYDPARDSAAMLRRLGVLTLMVALPLSAAAYRIGPVVAYIVGTVLLVIAAGLDGAPRAARETLPRFARAVPFVAAGIAVGWAALSFAWTPAPTPLRQGAGLVLVLALGLAALAALPERMRSANLYPIPVGAGALALLAIGLAAGFWGDEAEERVRQFERTLAILVLFAWPAIAWLRSRRRDLEALALALGTAVAAALGPSPAPIIAFAIGALAHLLAQLSTTSLRVIGLLLAAVIVLSPAFVAVAAMTRALPADLAAQVAAWHGALLGDPGRLLTGHGVNSLALRPDLGGMPGAPIPALWYELGLVGVAAIAVAVAGTASRLSVWLGPLAPGSIAAIVTVFVLTADGIGGGALWWPAALVTGALLFVAAARGQFRTRRPRAAGEPAMEKGAR